jgi:hypothetical protein
VRSCGRRADRLGCLKSASSAKIRGRYVISEDPRHPRQTVICGDPRYPRQTQSLSPLRRSVVE